MVFRKIFIVVPVAVALTAGGAWAVFHKPAHPSSSSSKTAATAYSGIRVETGTIEDVVTAQGKLEPKEYVDVGAQVSGQLEKIHAAIGDVVKTGDLIAEIDPEIYESRARANEARLKTLSAQLLQQEAQVAQAAQKFERSQKLIRAKAVSQEIFQDSETALAIAQAQRDALKAQIEEAQSTLDGDRTNLGYTRIYAPISGTVVVQDVREGQTLNANQTAPTIMRLADLGTMTVRAQVAEADVTRLKAGMPVYFTTLGSGDRKWEGAVRQILPSPEIINDVVLYNVLVDADNKDNQLMTGMSTQMFFVLGRADGVPVIPVAALGKRMAPQDSDAGKAYQVRLFKGKNATEEKIIHAGLMDRTMVEIKDGLSVGDTVAVAASPSSGNGGNQNRNNAGGPRGMGGPRL